MFGVQTVNSSYKTLEGVMLSLNSGIQGSPNQCHCLTYQNLVVTGKKWLLIPESENSASLRPPVKCQAGLACVS